MLNEFQRKGSHATMLYQIPTGTVINTQSYLHKIFILLQLCWSKIHKISQGESLSLSYPASSNILNSGLYVTSSIFKAHHAKLFPLSSFCIQSFCSSITNIFVIALCTPRTRLPIQDFNHIIRVPFAPQHIVFADVEHQDMDKLKGHYFLT